MSKSEKQNVLDEINRQQWEMSSEEVRQFKINRFSRGESDGMDLPPEVRGTVKRGSLFGKLIGLALLACLGYLLFEFGGWISSLFR